MSIKNNKSSVARRASKLTLEADMSIVTVGKLYTKLTRCIERKVDVNLHAGNVASLDTSVAQLLLCFVEQVNNNGNNIIWHEPTEALLKFSERVGMLEKLGLSSHN
jgi:ABC-type transporter Mla MlaB component